MLSQFLLGIIIVQAMMMGSYMLLKKGGHKTSQEFLAAILLNLALHMTILLSNKLDVNLGFWSWFTCCFVFLYGPSFYFFTKSLVQIDFRPQKKHRVHLIPFSIMFIGAIITGGDFCFRWMLILYCISILGYVFSCFNALSKYRKLVKSIDSPVGAERLNWLVWVFTTFLIVVFWDVISSVLDTVGIDIPYFGKFIYVFLAVFVNTLYFKTLEHNQVFAKKDITTKSPGRIHEDLDAEAIQRLKGQLKNLMETEKLYRQPDLMLSDLAVRLNTPPRRVSNLINQEFGQNVIDFINSYRIEEAKERLLNPRHAKETIAEIMYDVGFNSKSSFNTIFKRKLGMTPSQFKEKNKSAPLN